MPNVTKKYAGNNTLTRFLAKCKATFVKLTDTASSAAAGIMKLYTTTGTNTDGTMTQKAIKDALDLKAPIDSPAFTGTPTAPTQAVTDDSTKLATTEFVDTYNDTYVFTEQEVIDIFDTTPPNSSRIISRITE